MYTREHLEEAFKSGKRRGASEITGTSIAFENFIEFIGKVSPIEIDEEIYDIVKRKMEQKRIGRRMPATPPVIVSAVVRATHETLGVTGVSYGEIVEPSTVGKPRQGDYITMPRAVCYYMCYLHTSLGYKKLAEFFGNRNHTTIISGTKGVHSWRKTEPNISRLLNNTYDILSDQGFDTTVNEYRVGLLDKK